MGRHEGYTAPGRARAKYLWLAPSKVRRVLPHLKGRPVQDAIDMLHHVSHRSDVQLQKLIKSARANYMQRFPQADAQTLYVKQIYADDGPRVKRIWRRGRGRADVLLKRMCHITAVVDTREAVSQKKHPVQSVRAGKRVSASKPNVSAAPKSPSASATKRSLPQVKPSPSETQQKAPATDSALAALEADVSTTVDSGTTADKKGARGKEKT